MRAWVEQLDLLIRSRTPILWIHQQEEERLVRLLSQVAGQLNQRPLLRWDFVAGLQGLPTTAATVLANRWQRSTACNCCPTTSQQSSCCWIFIAMWTTQPSAAGCATWPQICDSSPTPW